MRFEGAHSDPITRVVFSPNGKLVASIDAGWHVLVWSLDPPRFLSSIVATGDVRAAQFDADGGRLGLVTHTGAALYESRTGTVVARYQGSERTATQRGVFLSFAPDLKRLASALEADGIVTVEPISSAKDAARDVDRALRIDTHSRDARVLSWSSDGRTLAVQAHSNLLVYDPATGTLRATLPEPGVLSNDGRLVAWSQAGQVHIYDVANRREQIAFRGADPEFNASGDLLVVRSFEGKAAGQNSCVVYRVGAWTPLLTQRTRLHAGACAWADDRRIATIGEGAVAVTGVDGRTVVAPWYGEEPAEVFVGAGLFATVKDADLRVVDIATGAEILRSRPGVSYGFGDIAFSPDGSRLAALSRAGGETSIAVWTLGDALSTPNVGSNGSLFFGLDGGLFGELTRAPRGHPNSTTIEVNETTGRALKRYDGASLGPRRGELVSLFYATRVLEAFGARYELPSPPAYNSLAGFSPDGEHVVVGYDKELVILSARTGAVERRMPLTQTKELWSLSLSRDAKTVSGARYGDGTWVWDLERGTSRAFTAELGDSAFSADGLFLLVPTESNRTLRLFDVATGGELPVATLPRTLLNFDDFARRDVAAYMTIARSRHHEQLSALLPGIEYNHTAAFALRSDGALYAVGWGEFDKGDLHAIRLCRTRDHQCIRLVEGDRGAPSPIVIDEEGRFDGDDEALATVWIDRRFGATTQSTNATVDPLRKPGLLREFVLSAH
jgi:WD40 repeat protein